MKKITIFVEEKLFKDIRDISKEEDRSVAEVMREAMENYIKQKRVTKKRLSFIGIGNSGRKDIANNHEELLRYKKSMRTIVDYSPY